MIYRSNLTAPDLQKHFKHVTCREMPHSMGHDVLSDFADYPDDHPVFGLYKQCGFWTHDEAAILYNVARDFTELAFCGFMRNRPWLDVGSHTGWTAAHIAEATIAAVLAIDPMHRVEDFHERALANTKRWKKQIFFDHDRSEQLFAHGTPFSPFNGIVIDGDHDEPWPLHDAQCALKRLTDPGVILLHDASGAPVQRAVDYLISEGLHCKIYKTPHVVAVCWRGDWEPPHHIPERNCARTVDTILAQWKPGAMAA